MGKSGAQIQRATSRLSVLHLRPNLTSQGLPCITPLTDWVSLFALHIARNLCRAVGLLEWTKAAKRDAAQEAAQKAWVGRGEPEPIHPRLP